MMTHTAFSRILLATAALGLAACTAPGDDTGQSGDTSTAEGQVTDQNGSQYRDLGGSGTVAAATEVTASTVADDGTLETVASATVDAEGNYALEVPADEYKLVIEAWNDQGEAVASAVLESSGEAGSTVTVTPMDTESSVETQVFLEMIAQGSSTAEANYIDLRGRIDADTAVEVRSEASSSGDAQAEITALAEAVAAAQATEIEAWSEMGFDASQQAMYQAELQASQDLSAALASGEDGESAYGDFFAGIDSALQAESGFDSSESSDSDTQSSMAFRLTVEGRSDNSAMVYEATHAAAQLEARSSAQAAEAIFVAADAGSQVKSQVETAGTALQSDVASAASVSGMITAYNSFSAELVGDSTVEGSALGAYLGVDSTNAASVDTAIDSSATASSTFASTVDTGLSTAVQASGQLDVQAVATTIVDAWATYRSSVDTAVQGASTVIASSDQEVAADVMVEATGSFRGEN